MEKEKEEEKESEKEGDGEGKTPSLQELNALDLRIVNLRNVELNERLSNEGGGSGAMVYVCNVDGWMCAAKVLDLRGIPATLSSKFESEGTLNYLLFYIF